MARPRSISDDEIIAVAREVFLARGPSAPLAEVARRVGLSQPALSQRFGSKRRLLEAALVPKQLPGWLDTVYAGPDDRPFRTQLLSLARETRTVLAQAVPALVTLRHADLPTRDGPLPHQVVADALTGYFERARERGFFAHADASAAALVFLGTLQAEAMTALFGGTPPGTDPSEFLVDLLLGSGES